VSISYEGSKREIHTEGGALRCREAGSGAPLILLHGSAVGVNLRTAMMRTSANKKECA
jgi:hypothetical protein